MLRKKAAGDGCLNAQRRLYSLKAWSNNSLPMTVSRKMFRAVAGLP